MISMGNSFLNEIARKAVEAYIARNLAVAPIAPPIMPIIPPIILPAASAQAENMFVSLPVTPRNGRVSTIDFNQAAELARINSESMPIESVDTIYARYATEFPLFPDLPSRSPSSRSEQLEQVLEFVPITPPSTPPSTPPLTPESTSPSPSDTFVVLDLSPKHM
jgi:hypothetical protein